MSYITSPITSIRPGTSSARSVSAERSSGQRRSCAAASTSTRVRSSGIVQSPLRSPASTWASGVSLAAAAPGAGAASSWCRRRQASSRATPPRAHGRFPAPSPLLGPCAGRVGRRARQVRARRRRSATARGRSAARCAGRPRRSRAPRSAADTAADLMNWGRFPTMESTLTPATLVSRLGPLAQLVEQGTLNPKVEGSNPSRPTFRTLWRCGFRRARLRVSLGNR